MKDGINPFVPLPAFREPPFPPHSALTDNHSRTIGQSSASVSPPFLHSMSHPARDLSKQQRERMTRPRRLTYKTQVLGAAQPRLPHPRQPAQAVAHALTMAITRPGDSHLNYRGKIKSVLFYTLLKEAWDAQQSLPRKPWFSLFLHHRSAGAAHPSAFLP